MELYVQYVGQVPNTNPNQTKQMRRYGSSWVKCLWITFDSCSTLPASSSAFPAAFVASLFSPESLTIFLCPKERQFALQKLLDLFEAILGQCAILLLLPYTILLGYDEIITLLSSFTVSFVFCVLAGLFYVVFYVVLQLPCFLIIFHLLINFEGRE